MILLAEEEVAEVEEVEEVDTEEGEEEVEAEVEEALLHQQARQRQQRTSSIQVTSPALSLLAP